MKLVQNLDIQAGTRVLLRCDLNLPQDDSENFTDFFRLESSLPTIEYLQDREATIFITSHLGSPKGKKDPKLSLQKLVPVLTEQLRVPVKFIEDPFSSEQDLSSKNGVFLVENLRFWSGEEEASLDFAEDLVRATCAELFVQDAFGVVHRSHASTTVLPEVLPSAAGLLLQKEIASLASPDPEGLALIVGGAKVESKLPVISNFIAKADSVLTGGMVANTFLKAAHKNISSSLFDEKSLSLAEGISSSLNGTKTELLLPSDYVTGTSIDALLSEYYDESNLQDNQMILDLGQQTTNKYCQALDKAKTVIWAGTLGFAEKPLFAGASKQTLAHLLELKEDQSDLKIIIGGGDTVDFVRDQLSLEELAKIDHLSTGGGASLLMLSGQTLPGIEALEKEPKEFNSASLAVEEEVQENVSTSNLGSETPILIANLKSHFDLQEAKDWLRAVADSEALTSPKVSFGFAPSNIFLEELTSDLGSLNLKNPPEVFAQDISDKSEGSNTGQVAATQLRGIAKGTIIGHSERRFGEGESNEVIFQKILRAVDANLKVVLCVGAKSEDSAAQKREVYEQIKSALANLNSQQGVLLTIAYEPVFAIGTGKVPTDEFLKDQLKSIRVVLADQGLASKVLYGGSVSADNAKPILELGFDGLLVGTASLKPESLERIGINISA